MTQEQKGLLWEDPWAPRLGLRLTVDDGNLPLR